MTPERLKQCLATIHWSPETLAEALECGVSLVDAWLDGEEEVPMKVSAWLQNLALSHEALEGGRPKSLKGKRFKRNNSPGDA
jgi:hypothetical protein